MYAGRIGIVDLGSGRITERPTAEYAGRFLGGRGINAALLFELLPRGCDALSPENVIVFGTGILCGMESEDGAAAPFGRLEVTSKSPETGFLGSANMGGTFGQQLKASGFDHLVVTGRATAPVVLEVGAGLIHVRDAHEVWGQDTYETQRCLKERFGSGAEIACIGPAGEQLVAFASVRHGHGHAATRTGLGCVMGSKQLKAIVATGGAPLRAADPAGAADAVRQYHDEMPRHWYLHELQQHGLTRMIDAWKHWWATDYGAPEAIETLRRGRAPERTGCTGCPTPCMEAYPTGSSSTVVSCAAYIYPSYVIRNRNSDRLLDIVDCAQRNGFDTVSAMTLMAWLMELREAGRLAMADTDGLDISWDRADEVVTLLGRIVRREGIGRVLADGLRAAAAHFGADTLRVANAVRGLPFYGLYNPETIIASKDVALSLTTSPRGDTMRSYVPAETLENLQDAAEEGGIEAYARAVHQRPEDVELTPQSFDKGAYDGKAEQAILGEDLIVMHDLLGMCKLQAWHLGNVESERLESLLASRATGRRIGPDDLVAYARRVMTLERAFNVREGLTRNHDKLPEKMFGRPTDPRSRYPGRTLEHAPFESLRSRYYRLRGWDPDSGIPTRATLEACGLSDYADALHAAATSAEPAAGRP